MLQLLADWPQCTTASLVEDLLRQARDRGLYPGAARAITQASLEYML